MEVQMGNDEQTSGYGRPDQPCVGIATRCPKYAQTADGGRIDEPANRADRFGREPWTRAREQTDQVVHRILLESIPAATRAEQEDVDEIPASLEPDDKPAQYGQACRCDREPAEHLAMAEQHGETADQGNVRTYGGQAQSHSGEHLSARSQSVHPNGRTQEEKGGILALHETEEQWKKQEFANCRGQDRLAVDPRPLQRPSQDADTQDV